MVSARGRSHGGSRKTFKLNGNKTHRVPAAGLRPRRCPQENMSLSTAGMRNERRCHINNPQLCLKTEKSRINQSKQKGEKNKSKERAPAGGAQWIEHWPANQGSPVQFPVRAHAWVAGQVPSRGSTRGNHTLMFLSLSLSSLPLSIQ